MPIIVEAYLFSYAAVVSDESEDDAVPKATLQECMRAQSSISAGPILEIVDIPDSPTEARETELIQPRADPILYLQPKPRSSGVIVGMLRPEMPPFIDLGGGPNTVSSQSSSSSEDADNVIFYSADPALSPSRVATSDAREAHGHSGIHGAR